MKKSKKSKFQIFIFPIINFYEIKTNYSEIQAPGACNHW